MVRAWKGYERFDGRSDVSTWLYRIATNVCIDQLRSRRRRELPTMLGPAGTVHDDLASKPRVHWLEPVPDARAVPPESEPERQAELRQSLRLAFVAALQQLPAKQRAVLLLKDVLGFSTAEIAQTLELTPASVNSALQRARKTLATRASLGDEVSPVSPTQADLIERYVDAFHRYDVDALVALLREDGTLSMPPYTLWLQGREPVRSWLLGRGIGCRGSRLIPTAACGSPAFGQYRRGDDGYAAWSLVVLELSEDSIVSMTHFLDVETLFPLFGLELRLLV
jgi:RNA polymerase sigma-70 factor (ECF subfamily)